MSSMLEAPDHVLSTLEKDGSRHWLYPRLSMGRYWHARRIVGYALIAIFVALPHIKINGKPAILLDIGAREFTLFGFTFLPTDTLLFALFMVGVFLTIFLLTALFGRVWCGWACPQTVYLEYVYRPIERLFTGTAGRGGKPLKSMNGMRLVGMYIVYLVLSMLLAHTFLAYFVGVERLSQWVTQSPFQHPGPFIVMAVTTGLMMFDFSFFREQLCLIACPYGRFQSVLLDRKSLIVAYDTNRGEPRGKVTKELPVAHHGDCVDCGLCIRTCPTGIDIRDGLQMECIHCTQCMDACDEIMARLKRPLGLIRYSSQDALDGKPQGLLRPRVILYPTLLTIVLSVLAYNVLTKKSFDVTVLRNFGNPFTMSEEGLVENSLRIKLVNRAEQPDQFTIEFKQPADVAFDQREAISVAAGETITVPVLVAVPPKTFTRGRVEAELDITSQLGDKRSVTCQLLGP